MPERQRMTGSVSLVDRIGPRIKKDAARSILAEGRALPRPRLVRIARAMENSDR